MPTILLQRLLKPSIAKHCILSGTFLSSLYKRQVARMAAAENLANHLYVDKYAH